MLMRHVWRAVNFVVTILLLGVLFIMVNYISSQRYGRWDFTQQKLTALSDSTRQTLAQLSEPVTAIVFYQSGHRLYHLVRDLLNEYARHTASLNIEYVDPLQDVARARQLVSTFDIDTAQTDAFSVVIFHSGERHKYLTDADLAELDLGTFTAQGEPRLKAFKGEAAFTSAILSVTQATQPMVWLTSGHGERSIDAATPMGLTDLKKLLVQQNMQVEQVTLLERTEIPSETALVILAGPTRRFVPHELELLHTYLEAGGRLLALIDPLTDTGLEEFFRRWGIILGRDIVVDPSQQLPFVSAANVLITTYTQHPIVEKMKMFVTLFPLARSARPMDSPPDDLKVQALALTSPSGWGEVTTDIEEFTFDEDEDVAGPVPIATAAEQTGEPGARLVVVGDSDFATNAQLNNVGNRDLVGGATYWLLEREELIGISPKILQTMKVSLTSRQLTNIFWISFAGLPLCCSLLGVGVWWRRRQ